VIASPKIKKKTRIVFAADIQTDRIGWYERKTIRMIQEQNADLIILGGDYLQTYEGAHGAAELPEKFRQLLIEYPLKAPLGVYAVAGNIGPSDQTLFKDTGIEVVPDSTIFENLGADKGIGPVDLVLLGLIDSCGGVEERGLTGTGNFIVMAGHYPNYGIDGYKYKQNPKSTGYREAERAPDLMLAGHTHGGQISLPWDVKKYIDCNDSLVRQLPADMLKGFFTYPNGGHLLISRGTGMERGWAPRIRFFCPPEISVIDLLPE
jgi:predicted MPP superfamily phosphohydrolase